MKPKTTIVLGLAVALVLAGIILYEKVYKPRRQASRVATLEAYPGLAMDQVTVIELNKAGANVRLDKRDQRWVVASEGDYPADPDGVTQMLDTGKTLRLSDLASAKAKTHDLFEVNDDKGLKVSFRDQEGKALAEFYVGKRGESYGTAYFRKAGEDNTYLVAKNLASIFDRSSDTWKDKAIARFEPNEARSLTLKSGNETLTLEKNLTQEAWELVEGETRTPASASVVDGIVRGLITLRTIEFPAVEIKETGLDQPEKSLSVRLQDNTEITIQVGQPDSTKSRLYLQRADQLALFLVSKYQVDNLFKTKDQLLVKEESASENEPSIPLPPPPLKK
ncbi:MAG: hypothetical protein A2V67_06355 [Deltaproteobacteria bacterium RBG_13_61_14]|nr:MAG: hypothetical protein A2V67_06355 [Deltaproteobacteria bacterium RBG_13_61_14]